MEKIKVFFDTNVLVYAHVELSPFHKEAAELLDMALEGVIAIASAINATSAKIFDSRIAAQALSANVTYLVTYNINDFVGIDGLTSKLPGEIITIIQGNR